MKTITLASALMFVPLTVARSAAAQSCPDVCSGNTCANDATVSCTSDAECVAAALDATCPCGTARNHGQHQSCVVNLRNRLRKEGCDTSEVARCAARSTCGKPGRVLCCKVSGTGSCSGTTCSNDPTRSCTTDADCTTIVGPRISRDAMCNSGGRYSSGTGSVCDGCQAPVACCVPSASAGQAGTCEILTASACTAAGGTSTAGAAPNCSGVSCP